MDIRLMRLAGFDYKGEPVPNAWPDVNSHFGFLDIAGFLKERGYWQVQITHHHWPIPICSNPMSVSLSKTLTGTETSCVRVLVAAYLAQQPRPT